MDFLRKFWPLSFHRNEVSQLVISVVIYLLAPTIFNLVFGLLHLYLIISILGSLVDLYCLAGIIFAFLNYFKVSPFND